MRERPEGLGGILALGWGRVQDDPFGVAAMRRAKRVLDPASPQSNPLRHDHQGEMSPGTLC
jgi:hypothetical protein